jgi:hypothetical protein
MRHNLNARLECPSKEKGMLEKFDDHIGRAIKGYLSVIKKRPTFFDKRMASYIDVKLTVISETFIRYLIYSDEFWVKSEEKYYNRVVRRQPKLYTLEEFFNDKLFIEEYSTAFNGESKILFFDDDVNLYNYLCFSSIEDFFKGHHTWSEIVYQLYTMSRIYYLCLKKFKPTPALFLDHLDAISFRLIDEANRFMISLLDRATQHDRFRKHNVFKFETAEINESKIFKIYKQKCNQRFFKDHNTRRQALLIMPDLKKKGVTIGQQRIYKTLLKIKKNLKEVGHTIV